MKKDLLERFEQSILKLSEEENPMAVEICKLGYPEESNLVPTAAVMWDDIHKRIKFIFNAKFHQTLTDEELTFITAHEAVHLLNCHVPLIKRKLDEMLKFKKNDAEIIKFKNKFNIAADCVVNDSLVNLYGFKPIMTDIDAATGKSKIVYGKQWVNENCHNLSVMEVFYMLKDEDVEKYTGTGAIDEHFWDSFFDSKGNLKQGMLDKIRNFVQKNAENSALSDKDLENIEKIKKQLEAQGGKKAGQQQVGAYRPVDNLSKLALNWNKIFFQLTERKKPENIWHRPNRKLTSVYPDIILPSLANEEKEDIFVAVDSSGSIDYDALSLFISVLKNVPKSFNVRAISFDTSCYDFDLKKDERPKGGGGTNFQIIEDWILTNLKKYPKIVLVLTDGDGTEVNPKYPDKWAWMLYGSAITAYCKNMRRFNIKDLLV